LIPLKVLWLSRRFVNPFLLFFPSLLQCPSSKRRPADSRFSLPPRRGLMSILVLNCFSFCVFQKGPRFPLFRFDLRWLALRSSLLPLFPLFRYRGMEPHFAATVHKLGIYFFYSNTAGSLSFFFLVTSGCFFILFFCFSVCFRPELRPPSFLKSLMFCRFFPFSYF